MRYLDLRSTLTKDTKEDHPQFLRVFNLFLKTTGAQNED